MPRVGEQIRLNLQLWDGATDKYVRAYLYNASGASVAVVDLEHVANGLYADDSVMMPATDEVRAVYRVFRDSGYSVVSTVHSDSLDVFTLGSGDAFSAQRAASLIGIIDRDSM